uniref:Lysosomal-associated transmembrane protein 4B n=1 Tax=Acrobeloides nanus TaxID=290746 RepID=A0A914EH76_9BILA
MHSVLIRNQDINDTKYFKCCCGCHVKQAAVVIAIISTVAGFLTLIFGNVNSTVFGIAVIVAGALVFYADRQVKAWAYIPFLVVQAVAIIIYLVGIFTILVWTITLPQWLIDTLTKHGALTQVRAALIIAMVILIIVEAFAIWFWSIVFRAYCYMCEVLGGPSLG